MKNTSGTSITNSRWFRKAWNMSRGALQRYGPIALKRKLWNTEFHDGRWSCLYSTAGDCVYPWIEKYARRGNILDLGCGSGNTANELDASCYSSYVGLDISDVATEIARRRSAESGRETKNQFVCADMETFVPDTRFDVILLRESIYYVPLRKVEAMLKRYSEFLKDGGVFVVRFWYEAKPILKIIQDNFDVVDSYYSTNKQNPEPNFEAVLVFRAR